MKIRKIFLAVLVCVFMLPVLSTAATYHGSLSSDGPANGLVLATGEWDQDLPKQPATINWWVTQNGQTWHYEYSLSVYQGEVSHLILETSPNFGSSDDDLFNVKINGVSSDKEYEIMTWEEGSSGNPNLPGDIYGVKFEPVSGLILNISFDSQRQPMWGDFYAKDGKAGTQPPVDNTCWNAGFTVADPTATYANGSIDNHILVPDTGTTPPVPEAGTLILSGIGLATMLSGTRFKRAWSAKKR